MVQTGAARRGFFEDLDLFIGLSFSCCNPESAKALCSNDPTTGLLKWSKTALTRVNAIRFAGCSTLEEKQLHMARYPFEISYDLTISPRDNVSRSPGFETPLEIFGWVLSYTF